MFTKIVCYALLSAVLVQSRSMPGPHDPKEGNDDVESTKDGNSEFNENDGDTKIKAEKSPGGLEGFIQSLRESTVRAIDENIGHFDREVDSVLQIVKSTLNAIKTILDAKIKMLASIPKAGLGALKGLKKD